MFGARHARETEVRLQEKTFYCQRRNWIEYKRLREKRKERKETKDRGQAPHISNSHATTEYSRNINPYNDTPRSPRDVEPNNNRKNNQS
jgi:hypothetical protein